MIALLLLIIFGLGLAFFATQNTGLVHLVFGSYVIGAIPLYIVAIASLLLGVFMSWLVSIADSLSATFAIHGKETEIREARKSIDDLRDEVDELQIENKHLHEELEKEIHKPSKTDSPSVKESFLHGLKHSFG